MNKNMMMAIGLIAAVVIGAGIYATIKKEEPMKEETAMNTEMKTTEMETTEMEKESGDMATDVMTTEGVAMMSNEGKSAPAFDLMDLSGNAVSLESLKGERVYLKFWASWCSICLAGMEELNELAGSADDFKVITVVSPDFNGEQSSEEFTKWFESLGYENITVLLDEGGDIASEYGVRGYPTSAYIGSDGILVKQLPGHVDNASVTKSFEAIY